MTKSKTYRLASLIFLILTFAGCGQKGPLYLDDKPEESVKIVTPEEKQRQKELKDLERRNESQPVLTY